MNDERLDVKSQTFSQQERYFMESTDGWKVVKFTLREKDQTVTVGYVVVDKRIIDGVFIV